MLHVCFRAILPQIFTKERLTSLFIKCKMNAAHTFRCTKNPMIQHKTQNQNERKKYMNVDGVDVI